MFMIVPMAVLVMVLAAGEMSELLPRRARWIFLSLIVAGGLYFDFSRLPACLKDMGKAAVRVDYYWSDAIYNLIAYLNDNDIRKVVISQPCLSQNFYYLTIGKIELESLTESYRKTKTFPPDVLNEANNAYIWCADSSFCDLNNSSEAVFLRQARVLRKKIVRKTIIQSDGHPVFEVFYFLSGYPKTGQQI